MAKDSHILDLKSSEDLFQELVLHFLGKMPIEIRGEYAEELKPYIEDLVQNNVQSVYLPHLYVYLGKSEPETLEYLISNAGIFSNQKFNDFLINTKLDFNQLGQTKHLFLELESRLWIKLGEAEKQKEEHTNLYENIKTLVNKFINVTV